MTTRLVESFRPRRADEVLAEDLDERRAREPGHDRRHRRAECQRREHVMAPRVVAHGRQPAELHREKLHQHHAECECRKRDAGHRERHADTIRPLVSPHGGHDAEGHADQNRPQHAPDRQPERRHETVGDLGGHRTFRPERRAEIPAQHAADEPNELLRQRFVESEILADELDRFRIGVRSGGEPRRIARQEVDEQEYEEADKEQRRQQPEQALG